MNNKLTFHKSDERHFIPFNLDAIIKMLLDDSEMSTTERETFENFCHLLKSIYHFEYHKRLENIKSSYELFNPNNERLISQTQNFTPPSEDDFLNRITKLLDDGNYTKVSSTELETALNSEGVFPISSKIDFDEMEYYKIYYQGEGAGNASVPSWIPLRKREVKFDYYNRVVLIFKVKRSLSSKKKINSAIGISDKIYLKLFRNIPKADVEMIFPDPKPRMKTVHKIKVAGPMIIGIGISLKELFFDPYVLNNTQGPLETGISIELLMILGALFGYAYKAYTDYKEIVNQFLKEISQGLYFRDVGNNEAVVTALIDEAEEQECSEAILGYYFLLKSNKPLKMDQLDKLIEAWMKNKHNIEIDFDVVGALDKLADLRILNRSENEYFSVSTIEESLEEMDKIWDNYFQYHGA